MMQVKATITYEVDVDAIRQSGTYCPGSEADDDDAVVAVAEVRSFARFVKDAFLQVVCVEDLEV